MMIAAAHLQVDDVIVGSIPRSDELEFYDSHTDHSLAGWRVSYNARRAQPRVLPEPHRFIEFMDPNAANWTSRVYRNDRLVEVVRS